MPNQLAFTRILNIKHLQKQLFGKCSLLFILFLLLQQTAFSRPAAGGWTVLDPGSATKVVYVSSSEGNDATAQVYAMPAAEVGTNPQLPAQAIKPFKTIRAAEEKVADGEAAWILLKTGDIFYEVLQVKSGKSALAPAVYSYYGDGTELPLLKTGRMLAIQKDQASTFTNSRHVNSWIVGLSFYAHTRNPDDPDYDGAGGSNGFFFYAGEGYTIENILIEGCVFSYYTNNVINGPGNIRNIRLKRNVFHNNYSTVGRSQGLYTSDLDGILLEENIFDHGGWLIQARGTDALDMTDGQATMHNHNTYFTNPKNVIFKGNSFHRGSSMGTKWTAQNGEASASNITIIDNLYYDNEIGISIGGNDKEPPYRFKNITITNNVFTAGGKSNTTNRNVAWYVDIEDWDVGSFSNNLLLHQELDARWNTRGINIYGETRDVQVNNNIIYNLKQTRFGIKAVAADFTNVQISDNELVLDLPGERSFFVDLAPVRTDLFSDNTYHSTGDQAPKFKLLDNRVDFSSWVSSVQEPGASTEAPAYPEPERSLEMYVSQVLGLSGMEEYYAEIRKQSRLNWREAYTAPVINAWIREGFSRTLTALKNPASGAMVSSLYPNPGTNELIIETKSPVQLKFFSLTGKVVMQHNAAGNGTVNILSLKPGHYIIQFIDEKSGASTFIQFIKQ